MQWSVNPALAAVDRRRRSLLRGHVAAVLVRGPADLAPLNQQPKPSWAVRLHVVPEGAGHGVAPFLPAAVTAWRGVHHLEVRHPTCGHRPRAHALGAASTVPLCAGLWAPRLRDGLRSVHLELTGAPLPRVGFAALWRATIGAMPHLRALTLRAHLAPPTTATSDWLCSPFRAAALRAFELRLVGSPLSAAELAQLTGALAGRGNHHHHHQNNNNQLAEVCLELTCCYPAAEWGAALVPVCALPRCRRLDLRLRRLGEAATAAVLRPAPRSPALRRLHLDAGGSADLHPATVGRLAAWACCAAADAAALGLAADRKSVV